MGGVEVLRAPREVGVGRGIPWYPLPTEGSVWGAAPENFSYFLLKMPYFDAF